MNARSLDRLLDRTGPVPCTRWRPACPPPARGVLQQGSRTTRCLAGKKVLIVDDDLRNLFALTSMLERLAAPGAGAENGKEALPTLQAETGIDWC